jgi:hypothetical protein
VFLDPHRRLQVHPFTYPECVTILQKDFSAINFLISL